jgi:4-hydroxy-4-methyl-2-oxoglutarate aldolase
VIENQPVLTIHRGHRRPAPGLIEAFRGTQTSHLVDAMDGRGAVDWRIKPLDPASAGFVGPALTCHSYPCRFLRRGRRGDGGGGGRRHHVQQ